MGTGSTFFFEPTKKGSENPIVTSENYLRLNNLFAAGYAEELNNIDHYYDSGNSFDNSYPGYGSSYADLHGGVAILFEQASTRGLMQETSMGYILKFKTGIRNQITGALSTVRTAVENREMLNDYMIRFHQDALKEAGRSEVKGYVFGDRHDPGRTLAFADLLRRHSVEYYTPADDINGASDLFEKEYSFFVPTEQPRYKMVQTMFETNRDFPDSIFYDATAWAMVYSYGLPFEPLKVIPEPGVATVIRVSAAESPPLSTYGYLFSWSDYYAPALLNRLMNKGVRARSAWTPFSAITHSGETEFCRGSVLIPVPYQDMSPEDLYDIITSVAGDTHIKIHSVESSVTANGPWLGNGNFKPLQNPDILLFTDDGVSSSGAGTTWHLLDAVMDINVTRIATGNYSRTDISRYNTIIMPSGNYPAFSDDDKNRLKEWVRGGGNLIATGQAVQFLASAGLVELDSESSVIPQQPGVKYSTASAERGKHSLGGVFCSAVIDITHPLGFGYYKENITVYRNHSTFIKPLKRNENNVVVYTDDPLISGFATDEKERMLHGTLSTGSVTYGRGHITLFIDDPVFRGCWPGTSRMVLNAIFMGPGV
ncbi:MAG: M14 family metallopeptidase [Bacteroidales bacterium]|nr:M14 family metallopeptidase [Bacteroidales bacterium]